MDEAYITLHSPRLSACGSDIHVAVRDETLYRAVDLLRTRVAEWDPDPYYESREAASSSRAWAATAAQALADLMSALAAHNREGGIRELVMQLAEFMANPKARAYLEAERERLRREETHETLSFSERLGTAPEPRLSDIVEALIALHDQGASATHAAPDR